MPSFTSPGAMAGSAVQQFLMEREQQRRQQMLDALLQQRQQTEADQGQQELMLRGEGLRQQGVQQQQVASRQQQVADAATTEAQTAQRASQNQAGVRGMMADAMTQGPLTSESAKTIGIMAYRENLKPPDEVTRMLEPAEPAAAPPSFTLSEGQTRYDAQGKVIAHGPARPQPGGGEAVGTTRAAGGGGQASQYAMDTATRTIQAVDDVLPDIDSGTAGMGSLTKMIPGSRAANVSAELSSVAANVAFNAIQAMREASKTGGALGQVSERELDLLSAVEGSIRQNQSPENLKQQLGKIRESMVRFQQAAQGSGQESAPGRAKWGRDAQGNPVRLQ